MTDTMPAACRECRNALKKIDSFNEDGNGSAYDATRDLYAAHKKRAEISPNGKSECTDCYSKL